MNIPILRPIITEKGVKKGKGTTYTLQVDRNTGKGTVKRFLEESFGVNVVKIRTAKIAGKRRRVGRFRRTIEKGDSKKAIVVLKEGQRIDVFEAQG